MMFTKRHEIAGLINKTFYVSISLKYFDQLLSKLPAGIFIRSVVCKELLELYAMYPEVKDGLLKVTTYFKRFCVNNVFRNRCFTLIRRHRTPRRPYIVKS